MADYNEIIPGITLGSIDGLYSYKGQQIESVISVTPEDETPLPGKYKPISQRFPISFKMEKTKIANIVNIVVDVMNNEYQQKKNIYIHCYEGVSRSAICVIYYLIKYHAFTRKDAFEFVKKQRPNVSPNEIMLEVLDNLCY